MNVWFTSDWHIGHRKIIEYCNRPFENIEEMDSTIEKNFFNSVKRGDLVYFLGDLSMNKHILEKTLHKILSIVKVVFIKGNHDDMSLIDEISMKDINMSNLITTNYNKYSITMCHYPMISWNKSHFNSWQIHGHHHNDRIAKLFPGKRCNVAVDNWNFKPVHFDELKEYMDKQPNNWDFIDKPLRGTN